MAYHYLLADPSAPDTLNKERFTPCTVVAREPVSPTAFILTIRVPDPGGANRATIQAAHEYGLWSVEVKQPQLQIARNYTPLPPLSPPSTTTTTTGEQDQQDDGDELRFFVRRYDTGEVSKYLSRLAPGDKVEIRGPHLGFDLGARLGVRDGDDKKTKVDRDVVFLAGGTGIAPAMQAARRLLLLLLRNNVEGLDLSVRILWANRVTADCTGCVRVQDVHRDKGTQAQLTWGQTFSSLLGRGGGNDQSRKEEVEEEEEEERPSILTAQLRALQAQYAKLGKKLEVTCAVDEEGSRFAARDLAEAVTSTRRTTMGVSSSVSYASAGKPSDSSLNCFYHSQRQLQDSTEELDAAEGVVRRCTCDDDDDDNRRRGRNLLIISGPEGFVASYVGPKVWTRGAERQGPVGGMVADLMRKDPPAWSDWLVLKQ